MEDIGFPRKDIPTGVASAVHYDINAVEFCSHRYVKVGYLSQGRSYVRRMPIKGVAEILAKGTYMAGVPMDESTELRKHGLIV